MSFQDIKIDLNFPSHFLIIALFKILRKQFVHYAKSKIAKGLNLQITSLSAMMINGVIETNSFLGVLQLVLKSQSD